MSSPLTRLFPSSLVVEKGPDMARILFTFVGGNGHYQPLVPIARAAQDAGHLVAFTGAPAMVPTVEGAGFTMFPTAGRASRARERTPLLEVSAEREDRVLRDVFANRLARERSAGVLSLAQDWRPDLIVCDEIDFGGMVGAERLGLPHATVLVIAAGSFARPAVVTESLNALRADHSLPPDPHLGMPGRYLVLSPFPPSLRDPAFPLPATAHPFRPFPLAASTRAGVPAWATRLPGAPTVYLTLGTEFNVESGDLFHRALAGISNLPINLVVTVGHEIDPGELGPQPDHVHIERYIPQAFVLPHCALVLSHGGSGSVIGALAHGLPSVLLPMGADQPPNAARCEALGVARALDPLTATPDAVREAVVMTLSDPAYRRAAERLRDEIAALPEPQHAVALLERLAAEKRPLISA